MSTYLKKPYLGLTIKWHRHVTAAEKHADELIEAAKTLEQIERTHAPLDGNWGPGEDAVNEWWLSVFDATELELVEALHEIVAERKRARFHPRRRRQLTLDYIRIDAMLTRAHGLETCWY